jgi:hypothetical protein
MSEVEPRITEELAEAVRSASEVAVTVTTFDGGAVAGAKYKPSLVIWPHAFPLQLVPLKLQITTLLEVPLTTAVNCACPPSGTCTVVGARETDTEARVAVGKTEIASKNHATLNNRSISFRLEALSQLHRSRSAQFSSRPSSSLGTSPQRT